MSKEGNSNRAGRRTPSGTALNTTSAYLDMHRPDRQVKANQPFCAVFAFKCRRQSVDAGGVVHASGVPGHKAWLLLPPACTRSRGCFFAPADVDLNTDCKGLLLRFPRRCARFPRRSVVSSATTAAFNRSVPRQRMQRSDNHLMAIDFEELA